MFTPCGAFSFAVWGGMTQPKAQPTEPRKGAQMNGKQAAFAVVRVVICAATFSGLVYILILNSRTGAAVVVTRSGCIPPRGGNTQPAARGREYREYPKIGKRNKKDNI